MHNFSNKTIIITGASSGLGKELAINLNKLNANLILIARNKSKLQKLQNSLMAYNQEHNKNNDIKIIPLDISDYKQLTKKLNVLKSQKIDILINNAAIWYEGDFLEHSNQKLKELFEVNVLGQMYITKQILPIMQKQNKGDIVFVNSIASTREYPENFAPYASTKFAIKGFAESIRQKYAKHNIRIMQIYPPGMNTNLFKSAGFDYGKAAWMTEPKNIAKIIIFMLSMPRDITLSNVVVNKTGFN